VQEQGRVVDVTGGVSLCRAERSVVKLELGQRIAALEAEVPDDEIAFGLPGPGFLPVAAGAFI